MPLSPQTIERLLAVKAAILANPAEYDQSVGTVCYSGCGSAGCIFGWAVGLFGTNDEKALASENFGYVYAVGAAVLGLQFDSSISLRVGWVRTADDVTTEAGRLFNQKAWPDQFTDAEAATAAKRIDHFIATDGRE